MTTVQFMLGNGVFIDCGDRTEEFLDRCIAQAIKATSNGFAIEKREFLSKIVDRETAMLALESGKILSTGRGGWDDQVRIKPAAIKPQPQTNTKPLLRCRCGNTGHAGAYPFSTLPGSGRCDDCV